MQAPHTFVDLVIADADMLNSLAGWYTPPRLRLDNAGNLTALTTGALAAITFSDANEVDDTDAMHSGTTNPTRITVATVGFYLLRARVSWGTAVTGTYRTCQLFKNGTFLTAEVAAASSMAAAQQNGVAEHVFTERIATVGDYFEFKLAQDTGGTVSPAVTVEAVWLGTS